MAIVAILIMRAIDSFLFKKAICFASNFFHAEKLHRNLLLASLLGPI
jgi:hypothetical protein